MKIFAILLRDRVASVCFQQFWDSMFHPRQIQSSGRTVFHYSKRRIYLLYTLALIFSYEVADEMEPDKIDEMETFSSELLQYFKLIDGNSVNFTKLLPTVTIYINGCSRKKCSKYAKPYYCECCRPLWTGEYGNCYGWFTHKEFFIDRFRNLE